MQKYGDAFSKSSSIYNLNAVHLYICLFGQKCLTRYSALNPLRGLTGSNGQNISDHIDLLPALL